MIRRNLTLDDGTQFWLLISQVAHARISGELTSAWQEPFTDEVIDAVTRHDDGWAKWEAAPQLDIKRGRPLSFTEMVVADAIVIWDDSIDAGRRIGRLAGALVAGHFIGLARGSEHAAQSPAREWLQRRAADRENWLAQWRNESLSNSDALADSGQRMLLTADLLSLWLCMDGPIAGGMVTDDQAAVANSEMEARSTTVLGKYRFVEHQKQVATAGVDWLGTLEPWPFRASELNLASPARCVPVGSYETWQKIAAAARPATLRWRLRQTLPPESEC